MSDHQTDLEHLEQLIDAALSTYGRPAQDAGLEARLLAQLQAERQRAHRRRRMLWAAGALAATACMLLLVAPWRSASPHAEPRIQARNEQPGATLPRVTSAVEMNRSTTTRLHRADRPAMAGSTPPKLDVFPMPAPVTAEEQALVQFAAQSTKPQMKELMTDEQPVEPIDIAAISIPPIKPPSEGNE